MTREKYPVETFLTAEQMAQLAALAEQTGKSVGELIQTAVEQVYFQRPQQQALARLLALDAPVADWSQMEAEIEQGRLE